jgi:hypothetical protein
MRPILVCDVLAFARILLMHQGKDRMALAHRVMSEAAAADAFRQRHGVAHPDWGDGSIFLRCLNMRPPPEPGGNSIQHLQAIAFAATLLCDLLAGQAD